MKSACSKIFVCKEEIWQIIGLSLFTDTVVVCRRLYVSLCFVNSFITNIEKEFDYSYASRFVIISFLIFHFSESQRNIIRHASIKSVGKN